MRAVLIVTICLLASCGPRGGTVVTDQGVVVDSIGLTDELTLRHATQDGDGVWSFEMLHLGVGNYTGLHTMTLAWPGGEPLQLPGRGRLLDVARDRRGAIFIEQAVFAMTDEEAAALLAASPPVTYRFEGDHGGVAPRALTAGQLRAMRTFIAGRQRERAHMD